MFYFRGDKKGSLAKCWEGHYEMLLRKGKSKTSVVSVLAKPVLYS